MHEETRMRGGDKNEKKGEKTQIKIAVKKKAE